MYLLIESKGRSQDFTEGSIPKHLVAFATPMLLGNALQALYSTVDSIWVGQFLGANGIAAVSVSFPVTFAVISLAMGVSMATTTLVAQYSGAKDPVMVRRTITNSVIITLVLAAFGTFLGVVYRYPILRLINTPPEIIDWAADYLGVIFAGVLATFVYNLNSAIMRGLGDSRTPLKFLAYATALNIVLDPLMIFGIGPFPKMDVGGAALATIISQGFSAVLGISYMLKHQMITKDRRDWKVDSRLVKLTFSIGLPAGFQQIITSLGMLTMTSLVNSFGANVTAGFGIGSRLDQFAFMPAQSLGLAVTALVGQNLGAGLKDRVKEVVKWSILITVSITAVVSAIVLLFPGILLRMFTSEAPALQQGVGYLRILGVAYIPYALMFTLSGILRGAGDTFPSMLISIFILWVVRVPLSVFLSKTMGPTGIWIGMGTSPCFGAALNYAYFLSGRWKSRVLTRGTESNSLLDAAGNGES